MKDDYSEIIVNRILSLCKTGYFYISTVHYEWCEPFDD